VRLVLRNTKLVIAVALALVAGIVASGCGVHVETDGPHTVQTRPIGVFDSVELHGSTNVVVRRGRPRTLIVEGGRHRVDDLITRVQGSTLVVERRNSSGTIELGGDAVTVSVWTPKLDAARIDGSGDLRLLLLDGGSLRLLTNGSGGVHASGRLDRLQADVDGSGDQRVGQRRRGCRCRAIARRHGPRQRRRALHRAPAADP
jgi:Putative auto-transporter adhesin, head GIN domain